MTEDVPFYVELARQADGPSWSSRSGRDGSRSRSPGAIGRPRDRDRRVAGDARASAAAPPRRGRRARPPPAGHARPRARRAGGARLLPVPVAPAPADAGPTGVDVFERVAASLRPGGRFAWNAFVFDPHDRGGARRRVAATGTAPATASTTTRPTAGSTSRSRAARASRCGGSPRSEWDGAARRQRPRARGALRLVRPPPVRRRQPRADRRGAEAGVSEALYDSIARIYDPWSVSVTEDVELLRRGGASRSGGPVVELAVGTGASRCRSRRRGST